MAWLVGPVPVTALAGTGVGVPGNASVRRVIARQPFDLPLMPGSSRASTKLMLAACSPMSGWPDSLTRRTSMIGLPSSGIVALTIDERMNLAEATGTPLPPVGGGPGGVTGPGGLSGPCLASSPEQAASASAAQASNATQRGLGRASVRSFSNVMSRTPILVGAEAGRPTGTRPDHHSA